MLSRSVTLASAIILVCSVCSALSAQNRFDNVEIKATHVAKAVHMLEGAGGNIGVSVGEDGVLMIDDQFAPLAEKIRTAIGKISDRPIRLLLNTHHHGDHTGGNAEFGKTSTIIAHRNVRKRLAAGKNTPRSALPVVTYEKTVSLHFNGEDIEILHLPAGHTDGDSVIFFKGSKVVHMGDHFFNGRFPVHRSRKRRLGERFHS